MKREPDPYVLEGLIDIFLQTGSFEVTASDLARSLGYCPSTIKKRLTLLVGKGIIQDRRMANSWAFHLKLPLPEEVRAEIERKLKAGNRDYCIANEIHDYVLGIGNYATGNEN